MQQVGNRTVNTRQFMMSLSMVWRQLDFKDKEKETVNQRIHSKEWNYDNGALGKTILVAMWRMTWRNAKIWRWENSRRLCGNPGGMSVCPELGGGARNGEDLSIWKTARRRNFPRRVSVSSWIYESGVQEKGLRCDNPKYVWQMLTGAVGLGG